jgi:hypothetical protein
MAIATTHEGHAGKQTNYQSFHQAYFDFSFSSRKRNPARKSGVSWFTYSLSSNSFIISMAE